MTAVLLTLAVFAFWLLLGHALLALCRRGPALPNLLLAPAVGIAVTAVTVFLCSRAGLSANRFAWPLTLTLVAATAVLLWRVRPPAKWKSYGPFAGVLLGGLLLTGRPMLEFGFEWLSYCNDDMANYSLRAQRLQNNGFNDFPPLQDLVQGRDYSQFYWFMDVPGGMRVGSDLVLAWLASLTGLSPHQVFMPLMLAFHLALLSVAGAVVCPSLEQRGQALMTCVLLALSALTTLGTLAQLIAQVAGLALLGGCATVLMQPLAGTDLRAAVRHGALSGLMVTAQLLVYPEVFPFLFVGLVVYLGLGLRRGTVAPRPLLAAAAVATATALVLLNLYAGATLSFLLMQAGHSGKFKILLADIFPFYLLPSGLANLWGLLALGGDPSQAPWISARIVLGACLLLAAVVTALTLTRRGEPGGILTLVMLALSAFLFATSDAFGLFKMSMFLQPFVLGALVTAWWSVVRSPPARVVPLLLLALVSWRTGTQGQYVEASRGKGPSFVDVPDASASRINAEFRAALASVPARRLILDTFNPSLIKFQLMYTRGLPAAVPSMNQFIVDAGVLALQRRDVLLTEEVLERGSLMDARVREQLPVADFHLHDETNPGANNRFTLNRLGRTTGAGAYLVKTTGRLTILNRRHGRPDETHNFVVAPLGDVHDHLIFTMSDLGRHYFGNTARQNQVAMYQVEKDPMFPGRTVAACGRHLLFEVVNPTPGARLQLSLSTTLKADGESRLPPAAAIGDGRWAFPLVGRGSARVFSPPLTPQVILGPSYLGVDMCAPATGFTYGRAGLMNLYGKERLIDARRLVAFGRDISLVSASEYAALQPPARVERFPHDLDNPNLEYSGVYEDGWASENCFFCLKGCNSEASRERQRPEDSEPEDSEPEDSGRSRSRLAIAVVRGTVPRIDDPAFVTELVVLVDGHEVARRSLGLGDFAVRAPAPPGKERQRVELRFSHFQRLPGGDSRPVACLLKHVGLESDPPAIVDRGK